MDSIAMFGKPLVANRAGRLPRLVVLIPALNEEATIGQVIGRVPRQIEGIASVDVLVVDDGSIDRTVDLARNAGARVVSHGCNRGVGAAFATGVDAALRQGADVIVNMDGDGQFSPEDIPQLIAPILSGRAGFVTCTRFADPLHIPKMPRVKLWGNHAMSRLVSAIAGQGTRFTDVSCGFRAFTRETALKMNLFGRFTYTQETFIDLAANQVRIAEVPLCVRGEREFGKSRVARNLWRYAFQTSSILLRALRDRKPLLVFGSVGLAAFLAGVAMGVFLLVHLWLTGATSPYQNVVSAAVLCMLLGAALGTLAFLADMIGRIRMTQDRMLAMIRELTFAAHNREETWERKRRPAAPPTVLERESDETKHKAA